MARTSSLNCLSCRDPYQTPDSLNCLPPFHWKSLFFTENASSHPLPKHRLRFYHYRTPKIPGKEGKNGQKSKEILAKEEKKTRNLKKTRKGRTGKSVSSGGRGKRSGKPPKKQGFFIPTEHPKSLEKKGKTVKKARKSSQKRRKRQGIQTKQGKEGQGKDPRPLYYKTPPCLFHHKNRYRPKGVLPQRCSAHFGRIFDAILTDFWRILDVPLFPIKQDPFWRIFDAFLTHFWRTSDAFWLLLTPFPKTPFGRYRKNARSKAIFGP